MRPFFIALCALIMSIVGCSDPGTYYSSDDLERIDAAQDCVRTANAMRVHGLCSPEQCPERVAACLKKLSAVKNAPTNVDNLMDITTNPLLRIRSGSLAITIFGTALVGFVALLFGGIPFIVVAICAYILIFGARTSRLIASIFGILLVVYSYYYPPLGMIESLLGISGTLILLAGITGFSTSSEQISRVERIVTSLLLAILGTGALFLNAAAMDSQLFSALAIAFGIGSTGCSLIVTIDCIKNAHRADDATGD